MSKLLDFLRDYWPVMFRLTHQREMVDALKANVRLQKELIASMEQVQDLQEALHLERSSTDSLISRLVQVEIRPGDNPNLYAITVGISRGELVNGDEKAIFADRVSELISAKIKSIDFSKPTN